MKNKNTNHLISITFKKGWAKATYILVAVFILVAVATRVSIVNEIDDYNSINEIRVETVVSDSQIKSQAKSCTKGLEKSQVIVIAAFNGERKSAHYSTLSTMKVERVIKGDKRLVGKSINVYENNAISANKGKLYLRNFTPINLFEDGKEYLLFLNEFGKYDEDFVDYKNITIKEFIMADYFASSFCTGETKSKILNKESENNIVNYNDFKSSEFIVFSENQNKIMYDLKSEIIDLYLE